MNKSVYATMTLTTLLILIFASAINAQKMPIELAGQLIKDDENVREKIREKRWTAKNAAAKIASEMNSVKKVDLNGDGNSEFIISGIVCGNANCSSWIYRKSGAKYTQIPFESSDIGIEVRKTKTNGYSDLMVAGHDSASSQGLRLYKFDGKQYVIRECFDKSYADSNGKILKTPKITKIKCG